MFVFTPGISMLLTLLKALGDETTESNKHSKAKNYIKYWTRSMMSKWGYVYMVDCKKEKNSDDDDDNERVQGRLIRL